MPPLGTTTFPSFHQIPRRSRPCISTTLRSTSHRSRRRRPLLLRALPPPRRLIPLGSLTLRVTRSWNVNKDQGGESDGDPAPWEGDERAGLDGPTAEGAGGGGGRPEAGGGDETAWRITASNDIAPRRPWRRRQHEETGR
ncbi:hypothetical protein GW17_00001334 [Ensete ventricosum]|nr:hypothetical protein GW17_00001334 [Ensete ventricosum]